MKERLLEDMKESKAELVFFIKFEKLSGESGNFRDLRRFSVAVMNAARFPSATVLFCAYNCGYLGCALPKELQDCPHILTAFKNLGFPFSRTSSVLCLIFASFSANHTSNFDVCMACSWGFSSCFGFSVKMPFRKSTIPIAHYLKCNSLKGLLVDTN